MIPQSVHLVDTKSDGKVKIFMIIFYFIFEFDFKIFKTAKLTHKNEIDNTTSTIPVGGLNPT